ncbi:MAG: CPBP family glutamic-type intramembrane protease [Ilumatobacteraceae bacterium]
MTALPPPATAPAGWYPDPYTGGFRYFDGRQWTGPAVPSVPGATPTLEPKPEHPSLPFSVAIGALVVLTVSLIVGKIVVDVLVDADWPLGVYIVVAAIVSYGPSIAWGFYVRRRFGAGSFASIGWRPRWSDLGWGPLTWLTAVLSQAVMAAIILALDIPFTSNIDDGEVTGDDRTYVVALLAAAVVAAPLVEEMVFRGIVLRGFLSRMPAVVALLAQGVLFGAAHIDPARGTGNIGLVMVLSTVGVVLGGSAYLFRRLGPPMLAHAILNGVALTLVLTGALDGVESPFEFLL